MGVATAAPQIEGGWNQDGKGESVWDDYSKRGLIKNGQTCFEACDSYNRLDEDLALIKELGINSYRFSLSWPRIQPGGSGSVNPKGIEYYDRLIDGLLEIGVKPLVTLFHWDMPVELEKTAVTGYGFARKMRDGRISAGTLSERSAVEKGGTRGGCAAPPGPE